MKKHVLRIFGLITVFALVMMMPLQSFAVEETDEVTEETTASSVEKTVTVALYAPDAATDGASTFQFTLNVTKNAALDFTFDSAITENATVAEYRYTPETGKLNVYVAGTTPLFDEAFLNEDAQLMVGVIHLEKQTTIVSVEEGSFEYVSGTTLKQITAAEDEVLEDEVVVTPDNYYADISEYRENDCYPEKTGYLFAGWYQDESFKTPISMDTTEGAAYAKFVDEKVLTLQYQTAPNSNDKYMDLRLITSVDSLKYDSVGFTIYISGKLYGERTTTAAYSSIDVMGSKTVALEDFSAQSYRLMTYRLNKIPVSYIGKEFTVTPFWVTLDGTVVLGEETDFVFE